MKFVSYEKGDSEENGERETTDEGTATWNGKCSEDEDAAQIRCIGLFLSIYCGNHYVFSLL